MILVRTRNKLALPPRAGVKLPSLLALALLAPVMLAPAAAQDSQINPSLSIAEVRIDPSSFNVVARDAQIVDLGRTHTTSWQVTLDNGLMYAHQDGSAVLRVYDALREDVFIETGMGAPPDRPFWVAVQLPEEGYVPIYNDMERGWSPSSKTIVSYTDRAGLTVNNGARIVVTNLDIGTFAIDSYSVHGLAGSTDPPSVSSGSYSAEFLSGDPSQNIFSLYPFVLAASIGTLVGVLYLTKRR